MARPGEILLSVTFVTGALHVRTPPHRELSRLRQLVGVLTVVGASSPAGAVPSTIPAALKTYVTGDRNADQWSLTSTHAAAAWTKATGAGVIVAIIDTGVDATNPDLKGQLVPGAHLDKTGRIVAGDVTDTYGHGTHVAGIIAAKDDGHGTTGIAPGAKVMPINVDTPALRRQHRRCRDPLGDRPPRERHQPLAGLPRHQAATSPT